MRTGGDGGPKTSKLCRRYISIAPKGPSIDEVCAEGGGGFSGNAVKVMEVALFYSVV